MLAMGIKIEGSGMLQGFWKDEDAMFWRRGLREDRAALNRDGGGWEGVGVVLVVREEKFSFRARRVQDACHQVRSLEFTGLEI